MKADLRFYAWLGDFLDMPQRPSGRVAHRFRTPGSVKDAIESHGVPHTEVALIVVDGESVDFSHQVMDGNRVAIYPAFEKIDTAALPRLRPASPRPVRFVLDGHLRRLSHYLRLVGFDTICETAWSDDDLISMADQESRILLTRNIGLLKRSAVVHGAYVRATEPLRQLDEILHRFHVTGELAPFTRCLECNGVLEPVDKSEVTDSLPPKTRELFDDYVRCPRCRRVYWQGSHFDKLTRIVETATRAEQAAP